MQTVPTVKDRLASVFYEFLKTTYGNKANIVKCAVSVHLSLFFSVQEVVVILHRHEFGPTILLCHMLKSGKLIRPHGACTNIAYRSGSDKVVECLHRFGRIDSLIIPVNLEQIDVVRVEPLQGSFYSIKYCTS